MHPHPVHITEWRRQDAECLRRVSVRSFCHIDHDCKLTGAHSVRTMCVRNWTGDGCEPIGNLQTPLVASSNRDICQKQSTDGGKTWGPLKVIARNGAQANPVYDAQTETLVVQYMQLSPGDSMQMTSKDHGATWYGKCTWYLAATTRITRAGIACRKCACVWGVHLA